MTPLWVGACNLESTEGYVCICDTGTSHGFHQIFSDVCEPKKVLDHQPQNVGSTRVKPNSEADPSRAGEAVHSRGVQQMTATGGLSLQAAPREALG